jgi:hypothetical protein
MIHVDEIEFDRLSSYWAQKFPVANFEPRCGIYVVCIAFITKDKGLFGWKSSDCFGAFGLDKLEDLISCDHSLAFNSLHYVAVELREMKMIVEKDLDGELIYYRRPK